MRWLENQFDWCKHWLVKYPILASIALTAGVFVFYILMVIIANIAGMSGFGVARGTLRLVASIPAIVITGMLIQQNGFKFAFSVKSSAKAVLITAPLIAGLLLAPLQLIGQVELTEIFVPQRLTHASNNIVSNLIYAPYLAPESLWFPFFWRYNFTLPDAVFILAVVALIAFAIIKAEPFSKRFSLIKY